VLLAQAQTGTAGETLKQGVNQYKSGNYEDAVATLQSIDTSTLSDKDRKTLNDALTKAGAAADQRRAARAEFEQGQADLNDNKPGSAITHFQNAAENKYADKGTQNKAREQMALAETMRKGMAADMKKLYSQAVASYKAGDLAGARTSFRQLMDMGYKAGAFQKSPQDFIKEINKKIGAEAPAAAQAEATPAAPVEATPAPAAPVADSAVAQATPTAPAPSEAPAPAPAETPAATAAPEATPAAEAAAPAAEATATATAADARRAYLRGRDQYRKGDWINARKNLEMAQAAGYKPGLFEDKPSVILARMDRKEQADSARASQRAQAMAAADANRQPAAQATEAAPTAVAQAAPSEPAAAAPAAPAQPATPQQELQSTAQLDKIRAEQGAAEARQLVEQGRAAQQANRYAEALDLYSRAQQLDPNNAQAAAGAREMAAMAGRGAGGTNLLQRQAESANVARQEIQYTIDTELNNASQAAKSGDFNRAREALNRARSATQINPQVFTEQENRSFLSRIDQTQVAVNTGETDFRARTQAEEQARINKEIDTQRTNEAEARRRTVADLINNSKRLVNETRYAEALGVIDQILVLDPTNDYAGGVRPLVEDKAHIQDQRRSREEHDRQLTKQLNAAEEAKIPYNDILRYPVNWPDISELRDQTTASELGGTPADQATSLLLERRLPELKLDNIPFTDVIDALRDLTNANIFVNWRAPGVGRRRSRCPRHRPPARRQVRQGAGHDPQGRRRRHRQPRLHDRRRRHHDLDADGPGEEHAHPRVRHPRSDRRDPRLLGCAAVPAAAVELDLRPWWWRWWWAEPLRRPDGHSGPGRRRSRRPDHRDPGTHPGNRRSGKLARSRRVGRLHPRARRQPDRQPDAGKPPGPARSA
jgi:hypothetical protein